jgi:serine/threonine-protein kinase
MAGPGHEGVRPQSAGEGRLPAIGELVAGKYRVERVLGVGGMGAVLSARHEQLGQVVALKVLHPAACESEESVLRFMREAQSAAALESDHVVRIFDVGTLEQGVPFMVMERLLGEDLANVLEQSGPLSVEGAVECVYQATLGVADAHAAGFVHRDLKPSNLFLTRRRDGSAWVKVLDFGISKAIADSGEEIHLTRTRTIVGSPLYMSPEQVRNAKQVDLRSDLWSLGVILHELLSGRPPFDGDTLPGVCARIAADPPTPLERADVPEALRHVIARCLEKNPAARFGSALELSEALAPLRSKAPLPFALFADERLALRESAPRPSRTSLSGSGPAPSSPSAYPTLVRSPSAAELLGAAPGAGDAAAISSDVASLEVPASGTTLSSRREGEASAARHHVPAREPLDQSGSVPRTLPAAPEASPRRRGALVALLGLAALGGAAFWGLAPEASGDQETPLAIPPASTATLRLDTEPSGAEVWVNGQALGRTPLALPVAQHFPERLTLELRLEGHEPYPLDAPLPARDAELRIQLKPRTAPDPGSGSAQPRPPLDATSEDGAAPTQVSPPASAPTSARSLQAAPQRVQPRVPSSAAPPAEPPPPPTASAPRAPEEDFGIRLKR